MAETQDTNSTEKKLRKKPEFRRKGPPCPYCGKSMPVSQAPKTPEELKKLEARAARDAKRIEAAKGAVVVPLKKDTEAK